jgi:NAD(P)H dehydrogenase (quinone)
MAQTKFLITGATGATGGYTVRQLLAKKQAVRVLAHRADDRSKQLRELGAEVVLGDFLDFDAIRAALQGVQRAYFCYPISPGIVQASAQFAQAAKEAGVEVIVNMSQKSARSDAKSVAARQHWLSERVFDWSGVPAVHLRPTFFADRLLNLASMIRQGRMPVGRTGRHAPVAPEDQARLIVAGLQDPGPHIGKLIPFSVPSSSRNRKSPRSSVRCSARRSNTSMFPSKGSRNFAAAVRINRLKTLLRPFTAIQVHSPPARESRMSSSI